MLNQNPDDSIISVIKLKEKSYESAHLLFNSEMPELLFVAINNKLF